MAKSCYLCKKKNNIMSNNKVERIEGDVGVVYDISLDGTVVNALGLNVLSNTDGFNFKMPDTFRYTDDNPYIGKGIGRNSVEGKQYTGVEADVCEFEDLYLNNKYYDGVNKMGLGIDEFVPSSANYRRKTYSDLLDDGSMKLVGNSIKSKKMPIYIEKFLNKAIRMIMENRGHDFLEYYYDYIEDIYNLRIPLKDIATLGKIKTSISAYKEACKGLTKAGTKKSRQAWYELAIRDNIDVNMGDTVYYINTGTKKGDSDVKRVTHYMAVVDGEERDVTKELTRMYNKAKKDTPDEMRDGTKWIKIADYGKKMFGRSFREEDEIVFNCVRLDNSIVEDEDDHFCDDTFEYNVAKYIDMFNKRISTLLVCFDRSVRSRFDEKGKQVSNILITDPSQRKSFTEEESRLVAGQPLNDSDQDTYEQLMTMEDKEIRFWTSIGEKPPYCDEIGMDWDEIVSDYNERMERLKEKDVQEEVEAYNEAIDRLTKAEVEAFLEDGTLPDYITSIVDEDVDSNNFVSRKHAVAIGSIFDIIDKDFTTIENE